MMMFQVRVSACVCVQQTKKNQTEHTEQKNEWMRMKAEI